MKKRGKRISPMAAAIGVLAVGGAVAVAMVLGADDGVEHWFGGDDGKVTQPLELRGRWLGMSLTALDSATAQAKNIPATLKGVMVVEIAERNGWRARQAGLVSGDVITAVDGHEVRDMTDFYDITRDTDVAKAITIEVQRWGQAMTLVLPAVVGVVAVPGQPAMPGQPRAVPGLPAVGAQPVGGPLFMCPTHGQGWQQAAVHPNYRCPMCNAPLVRQVP